MMKQPHPLAHRPVFQRLPAVLVVICLLSGSGCGDFQSTNSAGTVSPGGASGNATVAAPLITPQPPAAGMFNTPFIVPPLVDVPMMAAADVRLSESAAVIGVKTGDSSRAWLVSALSGMQSHVVIDTRGPQPVAVTWCDRSECARVLTGPAGSELHVQTGGFINGEMWLRFGSQMLPQSSVEIPYEEQESVLTTWQEWKSIHPDTTVYTGRPAEAAE